MDSNFDASQLQLQNELQQSVKNALQQRRPIITHLNADSTWVIQLPYPKGTRGQSGRLQYNLLIDPWLSGSQSDVASWFSTQWHAIPSSVATIAELESLLQDAEKVARATNAPSDATFLPKAQSYIDAVLISHEFTDHCHRATLLEINKSVPILATEHASTLIRSWNHFETVLTVPGFGTDAHDWRNTSIGPLPSWLGVSRIVSPGNALYYHSALLVTFVSEYNAHVDSAEAIIYTPHGINADDLTQIAAAYPPISTLALLHGLHDVNMSSLIRKFQLNLGGHNGLKAQRISKAKYWVGTHDEVKKAGGFIAPFLNRTIITLEEAFNKELRPNASDSSEASSVNFSQLKSGESMHLL